MSDFDDLLTAVPDPARRKPGRPSNAEREARQAKLLENAEFQRNIRLAVTGKTLVPERDFHMPVGQNFLARVLRMDPATVSRRLRRVEPIAYGEGAQRRQVYDFATVLPYLIKSQMDTATLLATLNPNDLPPSVNKTIWEAKRIRLKFEIEAGQAWATEDVLEVFGTVFMAIKNRTKLWVDDLREQSKGMTVDEVFAALQQHVDAYQEALHADLVAIPTQRQTRSRVAEAELVNMGPAVDDEDEIS